MTPIHAHVVERPGITVLCELFQDRGQEADELGGSHLPGRHPKFAMADASLAGDMARDRYVVGWVGKDDARQSALHPCVISGVLEGAAAEEAMRPQLPQ